MAQMKESFRLQDHISKVYTFEPGPCIDDICAGDICPYGIDPLLWITHFLKLVTTFLISSYADTLELSRAAIYGQTMARVLFFVNVKAVLNTIMVYTGWKRPGAFKVTQKAGGAAPAATPEVAVAAQPAIPEEDRDNGGPTIPVRDPHRM